MFFTLNDYRKIAEWLSYHSIKDSELDDAQHFDGSEYLAIVQNGKNVKVPIADFLDFATIAFSNADFINIDDKFETSNNTLKDAVSKITPAARKLGLTVAYTNDNHEWRVMQFTGKSLVQWLDEEMWSSISGDSGSINIDIENLVDGETINIDDNGNLALNEGIKSKYDSYDGRITSLEEGVNTANTNASSAIATALAANSAIEAVNSEIEAINTRIDNLPDTDTTYTAGEGIYIDSKDNNSINIDATLIDEIHDAIPREELQEIIEDAVKDAVDNAQDDIKNKVDAAVADASPDLSGITADITKIKTDISGINTNLGTANDTINGIKDRRVLTDVIFDVNSPIQPVATTGTNLSGPYTKSFNFNIDQTLNVNNKGLSVNLSNIIDNSTITVENNKLVSHATLNFEGVDGLDEAVKKIEDSLAAKLKAKGSTNVYITTAVSDANQINVYASDILKKAANTTYVAPFSVTATNLPGLDPKLEIGLSIDNSYFKFNNNALTIADAFANKINSFVTSTGLTSTLSGYVKYSDLKIPQGDGTTIVGSSDINGVPRLSVKAEGLIGNDGSLSVNNNKISVADELTTEINKISGIEDNITSLNGRIADLETNGPTIDAETVGEYLSQGDGIVIQLTTDGTGKVTSNVINVNLLDGDANYSGLTYGGNINAPCIKLDPTLFEGDVSLTQRSSDNKYVLTYTGSSTPNATVTVDEKSIIKDTSNNGALAVGLASKWLSKRATEVINPLCIYNGTSTINLAYKQSGLALNIDTNSLKVDGTYGLGLKVATQGMLDVSTDGLKLNIDSNFFVRDTSNNLTLNSDSFDKNTGIGIVTTTDKDTGVTTKKVALNYDTNTLAIKQDAMALSDKKLAVNIKGVANALTAENSDIVADSNGKLLLRANYQSDLESYLIAQTKVTADGIYLYKSGSKIAPLNKIVSSAKGLNKYYLTEYANSGDYVDTSKTVVNKDGTTTFLFKPFSIYIILNDYNLQGDTLIIPENCTLQFEGGSFKNGTIQGTGTRIRAGLDKIFGDNLVITGTWNIKYSHPEWFGARQWDGTDPQKLDEYAKPAYKEIYDCTSAFQRALDSFDRPITNDEEKGKASRLKATLYISPGTFYIADTVYASTNIVCEGTIVSDIHKIDSNLRDNVRNAVNNFRWTSYDNPARIFPSFNMEIDAIAKAYKNANIPLPDDLKKEALLWNYNENKPVFCITWHDWNTNITVRGLKLLRTNKNFTVSNPPTVKVWDNDKYYRDTGTKDKHNNPIYDYIGTYKGFGDEYDDELYKLWGIGGTGIMVSNHVHLYDCKVNYYNVGIHVSGFTDSIINCYCSYNKTNLLVASMPASGSKELDKNGVEQYKSKNEHIPFVHRNAYKYTGTLKVWDGNKTSVNNITVVGGCYDGPLKDVKVEPNIKDADGHCIYYANSPGRGIVVGSDNYKRGICATMREWTLSNDGTQLSFLGFAIDNGSIHVNNVINVRFSDIYGEFSSTYYGSKTGYLNGNKNNPVTIRKGLHPLFIIGGQNPYHETKVRNIHISDTRCQGGGSVYYECPKKRSLEFIPTYKYKDSNTEYSLKITDSFGYPVINKNDASLTAHNITLNNLIKQGGAGVLAEILKADYSNNTIIGNYNINANIQVSCNTTLNDISPVTKGLKKNLNVQQNIALHLFGDIIVEGNNIFTCNTPLLSTTDNEYYDIDGIWEHSATSKNTAIFTYTGSLSNDAKLAAGRMVATLATQKKNLRDVDFNNNNHKARIHNLDYRNNKVEVWYVLPEQRPAEGEGYIRIWGSQKRIVRFVGDVDDIKDRTDIRVYHGDRIINPYNSKGYKGIWEYKVHPNRILGTWWPMTGDATEFTKDPLTDGSTESTLTTGDTIFDTVSNKPLHREFIKTGVGASWFDAGRNRMYAGQNPIVKFTNITDVDVDPINLNAKKVIYTGFADVNTMADKTYDRYIDSSIPQINTTIVSLDPENYNIKLADDTTKTIKIRKYNAEYKLDHKNVLKWETHTYWTWKVGSMQHAIYFDDGLNEWIHIWASDLFSGNDGMVNAGVYFFKGKPINGSSDAGYAIQGCTSSPIEHLKGKKLIIDATTNTKNYETVYWNNTSRNYTGTNAKFKEAHNFVCWQNIPLEAANAVNLTDKDGNIVKSGVEGYGTVLLWDYEGWRTPRKASEDIPYKGIRQMWHSNYIQRLDINTVTW